MQNIDLSLSANPWRDLEWLVTNKSDLLKEIEQVDLSLSLLQENEVAELSELMNAYLPKLKRVIINEKTDVWAKDLKSMLETNKTGISFFGRKDAVEDCVPFHSIASAKKLFNFYSTLPVKSILDKQDRKMPEVRTLSPKAT